MRMLDLVVPLVVIVLACLVWRGVWPREIEMDEPVRPYDWERDEGREP